MVVPFDTSTVFGWYVLWVVQIYAGYTYLFTITVVTTYFLSTCIYVGACCEQFSSMIFVLDEYFVEGDGCDNNKAAKAKRQICEVIAVHLKTLQ